jgi:hypothetical protein
LEGNVIVCRNGKKYKLIRELTIFDSFEIFDVDKNYLDKKELKPGYTVAYVKYPLSNGREVFDVFQTE